MKKFLKWLIHMWPWALTQNERYDRQTKAIIKRVCSNDTVCVDIGCYQGDILKLMIEEAPHARHFAFEPIPEKFAELQNVFGKKAEVYPFALGNENKQTVFNHVLSNPTYSGLQKREYKGSETIHEIPVEVRRLDEVIPSEVPIRLIKIDVEGGELDVMKGAKNTLSKWKPVLIFEHGIGGADKYGVVASDMYDFLVNELGYRICLMKDYLKNPNTPGFTKSEFDNQFWKKLNCYFIAVV